MSVYPMKKLPFLRLTFACAASGTIARVATDEIRVRNLAVFLISSSNARGLLLLYVDFDDFHDDKKTDDLKHDDHENDHPAQCRREERLHEIRIRLVKHHAHDWRHGHHEHALVKALSGQGRDLLLHL